MGQFYSFNHRHLLDTASLSLKDITHLLDTAQFHLQFNKQKHKKQEILQGKTIVNLFFEPSTRTLISFELAAKRLGAEVVNVNMNVSSLSKGENFMDMARNLDALAPDFMIVRHPAAGAVKMIAQQVKACVINAGDGAHEHPSQALLDAFILRQKLGDLQGRNIAICGDILHSRVARSNINILTKLGANLRLIAPATLLPNIDFAQNISKYSELSKGIEGVDAIMMLRLQKERMVSAFVPSEGEFFRLYGLTRKKLFMAQGSCVVMHPGPINRGVEIASELFDDHLQHVIFEQVEAGLAMRQAIFETLACATGQQL
jgi:aspartate carbamoyltransferase catalytic subunit